MLIIIFKKKKENDEISKFQAANVTTCYPKNTSLANSENEIWNLDECTKCICKDGILLCDTYSCSSSTPCSLETNTTCCSSCSLLDQVNLFTPSNEKFWPCFDKNHNKIPHGATWIEDECVSCKCVNGESKCLHKQCPKSNCKQKIFKKGHCCPYCLENITSLYTLMNSFVDDFQTSTTSKLLLEKFDRSIN